MGVQPQHRGEAGRRFARRLAEQYATGQWTYEELARPYDLSRERVRQLIVSVDPSLPAHIKKLRRARREAAEAAKRAEQPPLAPDPCPVCLGPRSALRELTCSPRCAALWNRVRFHLSPERRDEHMRAVCRTVLVEPGAPPYQHRFALRVLSGQPIKFRGRWSTSPTVRAALRQVYELRAGRTDDRWPIDVPLDRLSETVSE